MNWLNTAFDWNQARAFLVTAEEGSFSAAARALALTQPTVGRQVNALEEALGVALFERIGRSLSLTPAGLELLEHVRAMGEAAGLVSLSASGQSQSISGQVCITASDVVSTYHLPPVVARLREVAPDIEIEILASNTLQDLRRREADIAIRHVRPEHPDLITRLIRETTAHLYASTAYLDQVGRPGSLAELNALSFIGFEDTERAITILNAQGLALSRHHFPIATNNGVARWEMAKQGMGVTVMPRELAAISPGMEALLPAQVAIPIPIWLTTHRELHTSRRIRLVFDVLAEALS